jgi:adenosylhomocysteine nucleosidase
MFCPRACSRKPADALPDHVLTGLGIVTGLKAEAVLARRLNAEVRVTAARADTAQCILKELLDAGVTSLLSFGVGGGLAPQLRAGDLVLATAIQSPAGKHLCTQAMLDAMAASLPQAHQQMIWASDLPIKSAQEKQEFYRRTDCWLADMESHHVAAMAQKHGLAFGALRVVCDPADFDLPPAALIPLTAQGEANIPAILAALFASPRQLPALMALGKHHACAIKALEKAVTGLTNMKPTELAAC